MRRLLSAPILAATVTFLALGLIANSAKTEKISSLDLLFARAIDSRFNTDSSQRLRLTTTAQSGAKSIRVVEMALKQIDGRLHALAEIVEPEYLRGTRVLSIEAQDRNDDQFIYMPSQARVRRISGAQRADLFFGTDVTLEDFERHHPSDFALKDLGVGFVRGETVTTVEAMPKFDSNYQVAEFLIGSDAMPLEIRYFSKARSSPIRIVRTFRSDIQEHQRSLIPERLEIENRRRGTVTIVEFIQVVLQAAPSSLFTTDALRSARPIPFLAQGR